MLQHPAAVFDLREAAPIVLTKTSGTSAVVRFPQAADTHFLIYALGSRTVLGELWGSAEHEVVFALPTGRYLVQRGTGGGSAGLEFSLSAGETRTLRAEEFRMVPGEQLATKGGAVVLRPNELGAELSVGASRLSSFGEMASFRYAYHWDDWALSFGVTGGLGTQNTSAENVKLASIGGDALVERRWALGSFGLGLGLGAEADVIWQTLERTDAMRVAAAGYPTTQRYTGLAPGPVAVARVRARMGMSTWVELASQRLRVSGRGAVEVVVRARGRGAEAGVGSHDALWHEVCDAVVPEGETHHESTSHCPHRGRGLLRGHRRPQFRATQCRPEHNQ